MAQNDAELKIGADADGVKIGMEAAMSAVQQSVGTSFSLVYIS